jgi:hypothetical protein
VARQRRGRDEAAVATVIVAIVMAVARAVIERPNRDPEQSERAATGDRPATGGEPRS